MNKKVAIIGSGPAGLTAAIYLSRASVDTYVYLGDRAGGQLTQTSEIENFPGFVHGINGGELMSNMMKQAQRFGAKLVSSVVNQVRIENETIFVETGDQYSDTFDAIIVATGSTPKYLGVKDEEKYLGLGYHTCATCDGFFYKDKTVAVVGGGDTAMEEASYLSNLAKKVYLIHRSEKFKASKIMLDKCKSISNIEFLTNKIVIGFLSDNDDFKGLMLTQTDIPFTKATREDLPIDGVFVAIGHTPNIDPVKNILNVTELGYLKPINRTMSSIPGIFIAGDVGDDQYRQAITAAGDGCKAAIDCDRWLNIKTK